VTEHEHQWKYRSAAEPPIAIDAQSAVQQMAWALTSDAFQFGALTCSECGTVVTPSRALTADEIKQIERDGIPSLKGKRIGG